MLLEPDRPLAVAADLRRCTATTGRRPTSTVCSRRAAASRSPSTKRRLRGSATRRPAESTKPRARHSSPSSASPARSRPSRTKSSACNASWSSAAASSATGTSVRHPVACPFKGLAHFERRGRTVVLRTRAHRRRDRGPPRDATGHRRRGCLRIRQVVARPRRAAPRPRRRRTAGQRVLACRRHRPGASPTADLEHAARAESRCRRRDRAFSSSSTRWRSSSHSATTRSSARPSRRCSTEWSARAARSSSSYGPTKSASPSEVPTLAGLVSGNDVLVGPIRERELRDVVVRPAQRAGLQLEDGLVERDPRRRAGLVRRPPARADRAARDLGAPHRQRLHARRLPRLGRRARCRRAPRRVHVRAAHGVATGRRHVASCSRLAEASDDGTLDLRRRVHIAAVASRDDATRRSRTNSSCATACSLQPTKRSK